MPFKVKNEPLTVSCVDLEEEPEKVLGQIRQLFSKLGIDSGTVALEHEGGLYRVSCNEHTFVVYRTTLHVGGNHHLPGWPVCLVDRDNIFQEQTSQGPTGDHCECRLGLREWLSLVERHGSGRKEPGPTD